MSEPVSESSLHILRIYANAAGGIFPARRGILREIPYGKGVYRLATAFFRTIILYLLLIAGLRLSGKRQIGELEPIELVLTLLISDLASVPMQDFGLPLLNGVVPILALIALSTLFSCASLRNVRFRSLVCGEPALVIRDGRIRQEVMHHNRLTLDELMEELRGTPYRTSTAPFGPPAWRRRSPATRTPTAAPSPCCAATMRRETPSPPSPSPTSWRGSPPWPRGRT